MAELLKRKHQLIVGDPHTHTSISDSLLTPGQTVLTAARFAFDWIALTDHNLTPSYETYNHALDALAKGEFEDKMAVFKGGEFDIAYCVGDQKYVGHVVAFFSQDKNCKALERSAIKMLHSKDGEANLVTFAKWVRDEDGVMMVTHPAQWGLIGYPTWVVKRAYDEIDQAGINVAKGVEVITATSRIAFPRPLRINATFPRLMNLALSANAAPMGGSDAHLGELIGMAYTITFANSDIPDTSHLFKDVQQSVLKSVLLKGTIPAWRPRFRNGFEKTGLQFDLAINEAFKVVGRYFIKQNNKWDPFYAGRLLGTVFGMMSLDDFYTTQDLKERQEAYRQKVLAVLKEEEQMPRHSHTSLRPKT